VLALSLTLTACGGDQPSASPAAPVPEMAQWDPEDPELTAEEAESMMAALEETVGASRGEIRVSSLLYDPNGTLTVDAEDPAKPTEFNKYVINIYTDRNDVTPYDYGGADQYPLLEATLFPADLVPPATVATAFTDSFDRVTGDRAELRAKWASVEQDTAGTVALTVVNGTERDSQSVVYDPNGQFISVS
jgi:hypothetical protein